MSFVIHRKPPYRIYVEEGPGGAMAHVAELAGCYATGSNAPQAVAAAPNAINRFLAWLKVYGDRIVPEAYVIRPSMADLYVAEIKQGSTSLHGGDESALYEFDKEEWTDEKVERTLRWLGYAHANLLRIVEGRSRDELQSWQVAPGRSIWDTMIHVANTEYSYAEHVAGPLGSATGITPTRPGEARQRLGDVYEVFKTALLSVPAERRTEVMYATWTDKPNEPWTVPKALRRSVEHAREHLIEINTLLG